MRLLHGERDQEVPLEIAFRLMRALRSSDVQLNVLKGGGHRLSEPHEIRAILRTVDGLVGAANLILCLPPPSPPRRRRAPPPARPRDARCAGLPRARREKSGDMRAAAQAFEEAAKASSDKDPKTARMWAAAGNLWIAANQPGKAALDLDRALAMPGLEAEQRGEALLDRARAAEAQNDLKTARAKANEAAQTHFGRSVLLVFLGRAGDPRERPDTAQMAISKALTLAPSDPTILFEAGHVADFTGDDDKARSYWMRAAGSDPNGEIGKAAAKAVEMLGVTPTVKPTRTPPNDAGVASRGRSRPSSRRGPSGTASCRPTSRNRHNPRRRAHRPRNSPGWRS